MGQFESSFFDYINMLKAQLKASPLVLGGVGGGGGGGGGPAGGFIGVLPQKRVAYDTSEEESSTTISGGSLVDNLNHIRFRINALEDSGIAFNLVVDEIDGSPSVSNVNRIRVGNGDLIDLGGGVVRLKTAADISVSGNVIGTNSATDGHYAVFDGDGYHIKDIGTLPVTGNVFGDATGTDNHIVLFDSDGYHIKDGGVLPSFVTRTGSTTDLHLVIWDGSNTDTIKDGGVVPDISGIIPGHTIQNEGSDLSARTHLNFVGDIVDVTDDSGNGATIVTINSPAPSPLPFHGCSLWANSTADDVTGTTLPFTYESFDTDSFHDMSTNPERVTIPGGLGGYYLVTATLSYSVGAASGRSDFSVNDSNNITVMYAIEALFTSGGTGPKYTVSKILYLPENEYLYTVVYQNSGSTLDIGIEFTLGFLGT
jgi:hypothetical protein